ncbi:MAG: flagellar motor switch protein FliN [Holosporaceae bacterium]
MSENENITDDQNLANPGDAKAQKAAEQGSSDAQSAKPEGASGLEEVPFDEASKEKAAKGDAGPPDDSFVEAIYSVPVKVSVLLGNSKMPVEQLVKLGRGAVVQLDKNVGDPVDIMVNERLIARGEVVMMDGALGVSIIELVKTGES